ncbi:membrane cofactor protein-like isoform X5 [Colossoma macropomum]|uniref:membrane cofactor protein-like isoform X5 n=1 Tax=Colossoma macropomum TaxID=42526 RepID=UPI001864F5F7|nr:membrane cofactor protein-like isoform X5 [Colossoma macropomum]
MMSNCCSQIIFLMCLLNVVKIRAQCEVPRAGDQRILTPESIKLTYSDGDTATFQCSVGYKPASLRGSRTITCSGNKWDYSKLKFQCTKKSCRPLPDFANGRYTYSPEGAEGVLFGATATAQCKEGFRLLRYTARRCLDAGWDGREPVCEVIKCPPPPEILNGQSEETLLDEYDYEQAVTYVCNAGYTLFGDSTVSCSKNGIFEPSPPECIKVSCDPPSLPNGKRVHGRPPYRFKSTIEFACNPGFKMVGSPSLVCERNGWNSPPPNCTVKSCGALPDFANGRYTYSPEGAKGVLFGATATAQCDEGFRLPQYTARHCLDAGWDGREPVCEAQCEKPSAGHNRVLTPESNKSTYSDGDIATFQCSPGYEPADPEVSTTITCSGNKWDYSSLKLQCTCEKLKVTLSLTAQMLEIEREKLELYRERLAVEKERLQLDRDRLEVEKSSLALCKKAEQKTESHLKPNCTTAGDREGEAGVVQEETGS